MRRTRPAGRHPAGGRQCRTALPDPHAAACTSCRSASRPSRARCSTTSAWRGTRRAAAWSRKAGDDPIRVRTPLQTIGVGARMNLFNFVILRLDYSIPQERPAIKGLLDPEPGPGLLASARRRTRAARHATRAWALREASLSPLAPLRRPVAIVFGSSAPARLARFPPCKPVPRWPWRRSSLSPAGLAPQPYARGLSAASTTPPSSLLRLPVAGGPAELYRLPAIEQLGLDAPAPRCRRSAGPSVRTWTGMVYAAGSQERDHRARSADRPPPPSAVGRQRGTWRSVPTVACLRWTTASGRTSSSAATRCAFRAGSPPGPGICSAAARRKRIGPARDLCRTSATP